MEIPSSSESMDGVAELFPDRQSMYWVVCSAALPGSAVFLFSISAQRPLSLTILHPMLEHHHCLKLGSTSYADLPAN